MKGISNAQEQPWLAGKEFRRALDQAGAIFWADSPLKQATESLSETRRIPIWLDRRCDPSLTVTLTSRQPLRDTLWEFSIANPDLDIAWSSHVVYFGPPGAANRWATVHQLHDAMIQRLSRQKRLRWKLAKPWQWSEATNPQELLNELEEELGEPIVGRERVLHDLWPANSLPPMPAWARLELLLSGYDLTFSFNETEQPVIRPMPREPRFTKSIIVAPRQRQTLRTILEGDGNAELSRNRRKLTASWSDHERLRRSSIKKSAPSDKTSRNNERYTLRAQDQPVGPFLERLAKQLQLNVTFSDAARTRYETMVSFEVEVATLNELMEAIVGPAKLKFELDGENVSIDVFGADEADTPKQQ